MEQRQDITRLADELGGIRDQIKSLKSREAKLRDHILRARLNAPVDGREFKLIVRRGQRRSFDHASLPEKIRSDPKYWKVTQSTTVVTRAYSRKTEIREEDDFQVIEPF